MSRFRVTCSSSILIMSRGGVDTDEGHRDLRHQFYFYCEFNSDSEIYTIHIASCSKMYVVVLIKLE